MVFFFFWLGVAAAAWKYMVAVVWLGLQMGG